MDETPVFFSLAFAILAADTIRSPLDWLGSKVQSKRLRRGRQGLNEKLTIISSLPSGFKRQIIWHFKFVHLYRGISLWCMPKIFPRNLAVFHKNLPSWIANKKSFLLSPSQTLCSRTLCSQPFWLEIEQLNWTHQALRVFWNHLDLIG